MSTQSLQAHIQMWINNARHNLTSATSRLSLQDYIRLVTIIGAYCLLRPYLMKLGARFQAKDHEREIDMDELAASAKINPNTLKGQVEILEDSESEGEGSGIDWGKKARRRQRAVLRKILDEEERLRKEEEDAEDDKDIQEFLVS